MSTVSEKPKEDATENTRLARAVKKRREDELNPKPPVPRSAKAALIQSANGDIAATPDGTIITEAPRVKRVDDRSAEIHIDNIIELAQVRENNIPDADFVEDVSKRGQRQPGEVVLLYDALRLQLVTPEQLKDFTGLVVKDNDPAKAAKQIEDGIDFIDPKFYYILHSGHKRKNAIAIIRDRLLKDLDADPNLIERFSYFKAQVVPAELRNEEDRIVDQTNENLKKHDLKPMELAKSFADYREIKYQQGLNPSEADIADRFSHSRQSVSRYLKLWDAAGDVQMAVSNGQLSMRDFGDHVAAFKEGLTVDEFQLLKAHSRLRDKTTFLQEKKNNGNTIESFLGIAIVEDDTELMDLDDDKFVINQGPVIAKKKPAKAVVADLSKRRFSLRGDVVKQMIDFLRINAKDVGYKLPRIKLENTDPKKLTSYLEEHVAAIMEELKK